MILRVSITKKGNSMTVEEHILVCAIRYALGRKTYIVNMVCQHTMSKLKELSKSCIGIIIKDIEEELKRYHDLGELLGDRCDERDWLELLEKLKEQR